MFPKPVPVIMKMFLHMYTRSIVSTLDVPQQWDMSVSKDFISGAHPIKLEHVTAGSLQGQFSSKIKGPTGGNSLFCQRGGLST